MKEALRDYQTHVKDLTLPLFANTDIDFFSYEKMWVDSTGIYLSSSPELNDECIKQNALSSYRRLKFLYNQKGGINSLHNIFYCLPKEDNQRVNGILKNFGYSNTFILIDYFENYLQSFVFSSARMEDLVRFCFGHFNVLIQFKIILCDVLEN